MAGVKLYTFVIIQGLYLPDLMPAALQYANQMRHNIQINEREVCYEKSISGNGFDLVCISVGLS